MSSPGPSQPPNKGRTRFADFVDVFDARHVQGIRPAECVDNLLPPVRCAIRLVVNSLVCRSVDLVVVPEKVRLIAGSRYSKLPYLEVRLSVVDPNPFLPPSRAECVSCVVCRVSIC